MSISKIYQINGILDTNKTVLENLEILTSSCNSFLTFDVHTGKWSVIVNQIGTSVKSFNDSNIIGSILLSTTGMTDYYNQVQVDFPHKDLLDQTDTVIQTIPTVDWLPNEQSKILKLSFDTVNDPVQAQLLGAVQLKQSRIDQIIKFDTDFTSLGLQAGDLITITNSIYGYTSKLFRVISISESDSNNGELRLSVTALEYNSIVYDTTTLTRQLRTPKTGIVQKNANKEIAKDDINLGQMGLALGAMALLSALDKLLGGSVEGGIFAAIMGLLKDLTGIDLLGDTTPLSSLITKDEGTILTKKTKSINFVGDGVTATQSEDNVTVTINASAGTGTSSNAITKPTDTSSVSTAGEVCPLSFVKPGTYYVPYVPKPRPWEKSCTIGKHWTVKLDSSSTSLSVDLRLSKPINYGSGPFYVRYEFEQFYGATYTLPKVGSYYSISSTYNGDGYVKCSNIAGSIITMEYIYNPGPISTSINGRLMGKNELTTTELTNASFTSGYPVDLKDFTLSNPSDLKYEGTYTLHMSCTIGQIDLSLYNATFNKNNVTANRTSENNVKITPKCPLIYTGTGAEVNQIIGQGTWTYYKDEQHSAFKLPPPDQSVSINYRITYNGETKTFTDTMTYVPYAQWKDEDNG